MKRAKIIKILPSKLMISFLVIFFHTKFDIFVGFLFIFFIIFVINLLSKIFLNKSNDIKNYIEYSVALQNYLSNY